MTRNQVQTESLVSEHRYRLLEGMAHAVAANGYAATTIADIVQQAAVSRRTFYEHFSAKSDCLIALYEAASLAALNVLRDAIDPQQPWQTQAEKAMDAYLECLSQNPLLMRTLFIEILGLGMEGLAARRRVNRQIANFMLMVINTGRDPTKPENVLSDDMAMAVVGGINELILQAVEQNRVDRLQELTRPALDLLLSVTPSHRGRS